MQEQRGQRRALVADIGATNTRFALTSSDGVLQQTQVLPTAQLGDGRLLPAVLNKHFDLSEVVGLCIGMAGPVFAGKGQMTNGPVGLDSATLAAELGRRVLLLNDFQALAHGVPRFSALRQLGGLPSADPGAAEVRAVLGPGSGLGMSLCIPDPGHPLGWRVLASEGGYADLAPGNPLEAEVLALLQEQYEHVCWETVLCGPGLVRLYRALAQIWGDAAALTDPAVDAVWITAQAIDAQVPLCHQTLEMFFAWLGAAAGNLVLTGCARGGVYIAGGIVPQLIEAAGNSSLRRRFEERGPLSSMVAGIPLYLVADEHPGLIGAAAASETLWR